MTHDISAIDSEKVSDITQNSYYKKLQKELKDRTSSQNANEHRNETDATTKTTTVDAVQAAAKTLEIQDKIEISKTASRPNKSTSSALDPKRIDTPILSSIDLKNDGSAILRIFGKKIDFSSQAHRLRQQYMSNVVQAKSYNIFLSKFAMFKMGVIGQLLSHLGSTPAELEFMQRKALSDAIKENEIAFGENIYNIELIEITHGATKKTRRLIGKLREIQRQLSLQMNNLGKVGYWNRTRIIEEEITQCKRIQDELQTECDSLKYQIEFYKQEV
jgi:hypothetical protein